jgi:hypothetical protein
MKNIKFILINSLIILGFNCQAQTPIINLMDIEPTTPGYYIKDINNVLNPFEGTYVLNDGVNYLKITFQKKIMQYTGSCYQDLLIGEYQYKQNGDEKINTLSRLTTPLQHVYHHAIDGNNYLTYEPSPFNDFTTDTFRLTIGMEVPGGISADLEIRKCVVNGQEAIQIFKKTTHYGKRGEPVPPIIVPNGFFYLIKE